MFSYKSIVFAEAKFAIWVDFLKLNQKTTKNCSWTSKSLLMNGKIFELPTIKKKSLARSELSSERALGSYECDFMPSGVFKGIKISGDVFYISEKGC